MTATSAPNAITTWPLAKLRPNPLNPRGDLDPIGIEDLAASIRAQGILQPLLITPDGLVVAGHRRRAAALKAGLAEVPVIVRTLTATGQLEIMLVENIQRADLTPLQEAKAFRKLVDGHGGAGGSSGHGGHGGHEDGRKRAIPDVARRVGVTSQTVASRLAILDLPEAAQRYFDGYAVPLQLVELVAGLEPDRQVHLIRLVAGGELSLAQVRVLLMQGERVRSSGGGAPSLKEPWMKGQGPDRDAVLMQLLDAPARLVTFAQLFKVADAMCCACGIHTHQAEVCRQCPLPKFLGLVVQHGSKLSTKLKAPAVVGATEAARA